MIQDFTTSKSKSSLHPAKKALLLLSVALAGALPAHAQTPPVWSGGIVLEMRGPSLVLINTLSGCGYAGGSDDGNAGGGPVSSPIDINDVLVIPPRKVHLDYNFDGWDGTPGEARVAAFCTESRQVFTNLCGERFGVKVKAVPSATPGQLELLPRSDSEGGTFLLDLPLRLEITLTRLDDPDRVVVTTQNLNLQGSGRFSRENLPGGLDVSEPTPIDVDCDGVFDQLLPAGGGLYLGVDDGEEELFCLKEFGASLCLGPAKTYPNPDGTSFIPPK